MKLKLLLVFSGFVVVLNVHSQELLVSFNAGIGQAETKRYKKNAFFTNALIGYEQLIGHRIKITGFMGVSNSQFDYTDNLSTQSHLLKTSISLTLLAKKIIPIISSEKYIWTGLGLVQNFTLFEKNESFSLTGTKTTVTLNPKEYNIALMPEIGYNQKITQKTSLSLSLQVQTDFFSTAKEQINKTNYQKLLVAVTMSKKLSRM